MVLVLDAVMIGGEVCEHGTIHTGSIGRLVQVDDDSEPDLEPAPLSHRPGQHILQALGLVHILGFLYLVRTVVNVLKDIFETKTN